MSIFEARRKPLDLDERTGEPRPTPISPPIREILEKIAKDDKHPGLDPYAPPVIRQIQEMAGQIADEHGIAQPANSPSAASLSLRNTIATGNEGSRELVPYEGSPLKDLAKQLQCFTFGTMMQLAKELKATEHQTYDTPEGIAALLHAWASKTLQT